MACRHRFYDILLPEQRPIKYLIIGTFNPSWNNPNDNNADYFYGRSTNLFWCICPHAFNDICLVDREPTQWIEFCSKHNIGLTDIIREVTNADDQILEHVRLLASGFEDKNLDIKNTNDSYLFNIEFNTHQINQFISDRQSELKGVFLTRKSHSDIPRIWGQWQEIKAHCDNLKIHNAALPTPSARGGGVRDKIFTWRQEIQNSL